MDACLRSRGAERPRLQVIFALEKKRAQGMPGARCTRGLMRNVHKKCAHEHTGRRRASGHSLRNGSTAYSVLSPVIGFLATVIPEKLASHELDASTEASGPHVYILKVGERP